MIPPDDLDLLERYLQDRLSPEEETLLVARLKTEAALADQFIALAYEEALLVEWAQANRELARLTASPAMLPLSQKTPRRSRRSALVAVAALLLVSLGLGLWIFSFSSTPVLPGGPRIQESIGEVAVISPSGERQPAKAGFALQPGQRIETGPEGSFAVVELPGSARLELGASTLIELPTSSKEKSKSLISVLRGFVRASVRKTSPDLSVILSTPHVSIQASETVCSYWSDQEGTRVELEEGEARLTQRNNGQTVRLSKGSYAIASQQPEKMISHPLPLTISEPWRVLPEHEGPVQTLAFSPTKPWLATGSWRGVIRLWSTRNGKLLREWKAHGPKRPKILSLAWSPDGSLLATSGHDKRVKIWCSRTGSLMGELPRFRMEINALAWSPDGEQLALVGAWENKRPVLQLWNPHTGQHLHSFLAEDKPLSTVAFSPDGSRLAAGDQRGMIMIWSTRSWQQLQSFRAHADRIQALTWSSDGHWLASGGRDRRVKLWSEELDEMKLVVLDGHFRNAKSLSFSPDDNLLAIATDAFVKLWDRETKQELVSIRADPYQVCVVTFSRKGDLLATGGWKKQAKLWKLDALPLTR